MILRRTLRCIGWSALVAAALAAGGPAPARPPVAGEAERITYGKGRELAKLANRIIDESSGLACGRRNKGVFWTHNDSGGRTRIFALNHKGEDLATVEIAGAQARDWEDMASFTAGGKHLLLLADVGDNAAERMACTLYAVQEPPLRPGARAAKPTVRVAQAIPFRYEDGPHNCESVGVDPTSRTIYLVSKERGRKCKVYELPWPKRGATRPAVARAIATLAIPAATGMDISPDGLRAVVLTYAHALEYVRRPGETWARGFSRKGRLILVPRRKQGESICYGADGKTLYLTSEKLPTPLLEVPVVAKKSKPT